MRGHQMINYQLNKQMMVAILFVQLLKLIMVLVLNELFSLIKTDSNGNEQWIKTYGGSFGFITSFGASVNLTSDGGYIATGDGFISVNGVLTLSIIVVKTDVNGTTQWIKTIGNNTTGYSVRQTIDGGYILAGGYDFSFEIIFLIYFL